MRRQQEVFVVVSERPVQGQQVREKQQGTQLVYWHYRP